MIQDLIKKKNKNEQDIETLIREFFKTVYRDREEDEYIRTLQTWEDNNCRTDYFKDIHELVKFSTSNNTYYRNTYFTLATTSNNGGTTEDLQYRYCLGFDFDKKELGLDFNHKDVLNRFKELKIHYHALVDSGNGYHAYVLINKTTDLEMVAEVQNSIATTLGADLKAINKTQLLRIPYTFNVKDINNKKQVRLIHLDTQDNPQFKPYDIEFLHRLNCCKKDIIASTNIKYTLNNTNMPKCIETTLREGSKEGDRYSDLQRIVVTLRKRNKGLPVIKQICKEWAEKSGYEDNLEYRIENIYSKLNNVSLNCTECLHKKECYSVVVSDFDFNSLEDEEGNIYSTYILEDKISKKIKNKQNRGGNMISGNELLILNVLKNEYENPRPLTQNGMDIKLLTSSITYKKKTCLSEKTLRETLQSLVDKKYILEEIGARGKKFYKFNPIKAKADNTIQVSYFATIMCICQNITPSELSLYVLMRYLQKVQQLQGIAKGNIFQINQSELAKMFYGKDTTENQGNISRMVKNLTECKIIEIYDKQVSKNNAFAYNVYRLNS